MKYALFGINAGPCADPNVSRSVAQAAEAAGFESLWTGEHVVLPDPQEPPSPAPPLTPLLHPSTALSYLSAVTSTIKLGTGITLLAQRNALVLAKEMASLDVLSQGRLILGLGAGYLKAEFDALGISFEERGARTDEYMDAMRVLWTSDAPSFEGQFVKFHGIQSRPKPVQPGGPPYVIGGTSRAAFRRAVTQCQGWYGFAMDHDTTTQCVEGLKAASAKYERPSSLGELEISVTPRAPLTEDDAKRYEDLGVSRLILLQAGQNEEELLAFVDEIANNFIK